MALSNIASSMKLLHLLVTLNIEMCSGVVFDISGSSEFAVLSKPFTFTCTATDAANITGVLSFVSVRFNHDRGAELALLTQYRDSCHIFSPPRKGDGTVSCGTGTNRRSSTTKKYLLQYNVNYPNTTFWSCGFESTRSNNFTLQVKDHVNSAADPFTLPIVFTVAQFIIGVLPTFL